MTYTILTVDGGEIYAVGSDGNTYVWRNSGWKMYANTSGK